MTSHALPERRRTGTNISCRVHAADVCGGIGDRRYEDEEDEIGQLRDIPGPDEHHKSTQSVGSLPLHNYGY